MSEHHPAEQSDNAADSAGQHHQPHDHEHIARHVRAYIAVGVMLLALTIITVALAFVDFGSQSAEILVGLAVATLKAGLVAYIFMHLNSERPLIHRLLIFTGIFFVALFLLIGLAYHDDIPPLF